VLGSAGEGEVVLGAMVGASGGLGRAGGVGRIGGAGGAGGSRGAGGGGLGAGE
jgi:hypothetical protein